MVANSGLRKHLSSEEPSAKAVDGNQALEDDLFNQRSCQVTWTYYRQTGSWASRRDCQFGTIGR